MSQSELWCPLAHIALTCEGALMSEVYYLQAVCGGSLATGMAQLLSAKCGVLLWQMLAITAPVSCVYIQLWKETHRREETTNCGLKTSTFPCFAGGTFFVWAEKGCSWLLLRGNPNSSSEQPEPARTVLTSFFFFAGVGEEGRKGICFDFENNFSMYLFES